MVWVIPLFLPTDSVLQLVPSGDHAVRLKRLMVELRTNWLLVPFIRTMTFFLQLCDPAPGSPTIMTNCLSEYVKSMETIQ